MFELALKHVENTLTLEKYPANRYPLLMRQLRGGSKKSKALPLLLQPTTEQLSFVFQLGPFRPTLFRLLCVKTEWRFSKADLYFLCIFINLAGGERGSCL
uniref:Uncharacterized protein n=1 Tax=Romanomermis culicivorax TaxID=13658 RepID=A0A915IE35_ROMCU